MSVLKHYDRDGLYLQYSFDYTPDPTDFFTHFHDAYELLYIKSGKGRFISEGRTYNLVAGSLFIVKRGETHKIEIDPQYTYERLVINFRRDFIQKLDQECLLLSPFGKDNILYTGSEITENLDKLCRIPPDVTDERLRITIISHLFPTLYLIMNAYMNEKEPYTDSDILNMSVRFAVKYIHDNLYNELTLDDIAKASYMSKSHISKLFRETTGKTIWEYITVKRLIAANRLITRGEAPANAAIACGFKYYSTFWRSYKKVYGHSPTDKTSQSSGTQIPF